MPRVRFERHVDAPPERVFALASNFPHAAEHVSGIARVEMLTEGPVGVGTRFRETRVMFGREATEEMEVTAFDPPRSYALGCENHGTRYHSEVRVVPCGDGETGCHLELDFEATPLTLPAKVMTFLMKPMMKRLLGGIGRDLDDIARAATSADATG
jgi:uncharacterized protein YndB with AHSA1/START domain